MREECIIDKFFHFARTLLENREELGLAEETARKIKDLKINTKKDLIRGKADVEILSVDILARLWEPKVNLDEINKLVDKKFDLKREGVKRFLAAFVELKGSLTKEQMQKVKAICKGEKHGDEGEEKCCR